MADPDRKRFRVSGADDLGDVHIFLSDDQERAEGVAELMREDLEHVTVAENGG
jgi:hypothetical protein